MWHTVCQAKTVPQLRLESSHSTREVNINHSLSSQFLKRSKSSEIEFDMIEIYNSSNWAHTWFPNIVLSHGNGDLVNEGGSNSIYSSDSHPIGNDSEFSDRKCFGFFESTFGFDYSLRFLYLPLYRLSCNSLSCLSHQHNNYIYFLDWLFSL